MDRGMTELYARRAAMHYNKDDYANTIDDFNKTIERQ